MRDTLDAKLQRIRETDAFLAVRLEVLVGLFAVTMVTGLALFLWHAVISGHELSIIATVSVLLGILIGIPIGRFVMPIVVSYIRSLSLRMQNAHVTGLGSRKHAL